MIMKILLCSSISFLNIQALALKHRKHKDKGNRVRWLNMCSFKQNPEACENASSPPTDQTTTTTPYAPPITTTTPYEPPPTTTTTTTYEPPITTTTTASETTTTAYSTINVQEKFEESDIVPDVLSKAPLNALKVIIKVSRRSNCKRC